MLKKKEEEEDDSFGDFKYMHKHLHTDVPAGDIGVGGREIGFMFGPEASGLSNKDLSYSNYILQIPTSKNIYTPVLKELSENGINFIEEQVN